jgi:uncharacterized membrane protein
MNNLILAASQTEGFIYTSTPFPNIFNTVFFLIPGIILVSGIAATIVFKEGFYIFCTVMGIVVTFMVALMMAVFSQNNLDEQTNTEALKVWAEERYQLDLTEEQVQTLLVSNREEKPDDYKPVIIDGEKIALTKPDELDVMFIIVTEYTTPDNEYKPGNKNKEGESW